MNLQSFCLVIFLSFSSAAFAKSKLDNYIDSKWNLSKTQRNYLKKGDIIVDADVNSKKGKQSFKLNAFAMHTKKCRKVLRKLSMLENYSDWIGFIKKSTYNEKSHLFTLKADHPLLPFPMIVHIIVERPTKQGKYPFTFPTGMFRGLQGYFEITQPNKQCLFYAESFWKGKKTKLPNFVIELFAETLSKVGGGILMRKTR